MRITIDDLSAKEIADFLEERIKEMREIPLQKAIAALQELGR